MSNSDQRYAPKCAEISCECRKRSPNRQNIVMWPQIISRGKMVSYNDQDPNLRFPTWMSNTDQEPDWTPPNCRQIGQLSTKNTQLHRVWSGHTIGSRIACCVDILKSCFITRNLPARDVKFWSRRFRKRLWKCGKHEFCIRLLFSRKQTD